MASSEIHNVRTSSVPSVKRTLSWVGHSRSFQVILIGAGRNPQRLYCRNAQLMPTLFLKLTKIWQRVTAISSISATPLTLSDWASGLTTPRKDTSFLQQCVLAVQGHPRSMILVPIESSYRMRLPIPSFSAPETDDDADVDQFTIDAFWCIYKGPRNSASLPIKPLSEVHADRLYWRRILLRVDTAERNPHEYLS